MNKREQVNKIFQILCDEISNAHCSESSKLLVAQVLVSNGVGLNDRFEIGYTGYNEEAQKVGEYFIKPKDYKEEL